MKKADLEYIDDGLFTRFYPNNKDGEIAYKAMTDTNENKNAIVLSMHTQSVIKQLRTAGYIVRKSRKTTNKNDDVLLAELSQ